jgi:hypothetical protein
MILVSSYLKEVDPKAVWIGCGRSIWVQFPWLLMIKNNHRNMPFYIFSENKNNNINIDLKTLNYDNVMANITTDCEVKPLLMEFEKGYASFSCFLKLVQKNYDTLEFRRFLESQIRDMQAKKAVG